MEDMLIKDSVRFKVHPPKIDDEGNGIFTVEMRYDCRLIPDAYASNESMMRRLEFFTRDDWDKRVVTVERYARAVGRERATVYRWIREGKLQTVKIRRRLYILDFDGYVK